uniref:Uncharacterized protein n=1 Tax=Laticauda laticaudata TaxID=8630 RepID=A0A8C5S7Z0_LATLA
MCFLDLIFCNKLTLFSLQLPLEKDLWDNHDLDGDRAEGDENKIPDRVNKNNCVGSSSSSSGPALNNQLKQLSLQCLKIKDGVCADK